MNQDRNRIFWIITDTILNVKGCTGKEQDAILCNNLRIICNAEIAFLLTYDPETLELIINAANTDLSKSNLQVEKFIGKSVQIEKNIVTIFRKRNISYAKDYNVLSNFMEIIDKESGEHLLNLSKQYKIYNISSIRENNFLIIGIVYLPISQKLRMMDLIGSYINLAGVIIKDYLLWNKVVKRNKELKKTRNSLRSKKEKLKEQAQQLKKANQKLNELNTTKDKFFSIIAHDLKNPFNTIKGFADILKNTYDKLPEHRISSYIDCIYSSAVNTYSLLENLLQWARSQSKKIKYEPKEFDINEIIDKNIDLTKENILKKEIELVNNAKIKNNIFADENMISTIIRNLLTNAIKYTPEKGTITICCHQKNNNLEISITDTGIGMEPDEMRNLFKIDNSFSKNGTAGETGTGLGLVLCKEFVEKNGGKIRVKSHSGLGTTFIFNIPENKSY